MNLFEEYKDKIPILQLGKNSNIIAANISGNQNREFEDFKECLKTFFAYAYSKNDGHYFKNMPNTRIFPSPILNVFKKKQIVVIGGLFKTKLILFKIVSPRIFVLKFVSFNAGIVQFRLIVCKLPSGPLSSKDVIFSGLYDHHCLLMMPHVMLQKPLPVEIQEYPCQQFKVSQKYIDILFLISRIMERNYFKYAKNCSKTKREEYVLSSSGINCEVVHPGYSVTILGTLKDVMDKHKPNLQQASDLSSSIQRSKRFLHTQKFKQVLPTIKSCNNLEEDSIDNQSCNIHSSESSVFAQRVICHRDERNFHQKMMYPPKISAFTQTDENLRFKRYSNHHSRVRCKTCFTQTENLDKQTSDHLKMSSSTQTDKEEHEILPRTSDTSLRTQRYQNNSEKQKSTQGFKITTSDLLGNMETEKKQVLKDFIEDNLSFCEGEEENIDILDLFTSGDKPSTAIYTMSYWKKNNELTKSNKFSFSIEAWNIRKVWCEIQKDNSLVEEESRVAKLLLSAIRDIKKQGVAIGNHSRITKPKKNEKKS